MDLIGVTEVAQLLRVSEAWVRDHATRRDPRIPCYRVGSLLRFSREEVLDFLANCRQRPVSAIVERWDGQGIKRDGLKRPASA